MKLVVTHLGEDYGKLDVYPGGGKEVMEVEWAEYELCELIKKKGALISLDEIGLPAKTSIVQTRSKDYAAGAISIIDMVRKAFEVKS